MGNILLPLFTFYRPQMKFAKVMFSQVFVCRQGRGSLSGEGVSVQRSLSGGSLSRGVSVRGVSVQGVLCLGGLCPGGSLSGGLCPGGSLSWGLCPGRGLSVSSARILMESILVDH